MSNIKLQLNANIISKLKEHDLSVDYLGSALFIMFALVEERFDLLDEFDDSNRQRRAIILYRQLERKGFLTQTDDDKSIYVLTEKGQDLVNYVKSEFEEEQHIHLDAEVLEPIAVDEDVLSWIHDYINLFPSGKHYGKLLRQNPYNAADRMEDFLKKYKQYNKDIVLGATAMYIKNQEESNTGHEYTRNSTYFIWKGSGKEQVSDLLTWCERYLDESKNETSEGSKKINTSFMDIA